MQGRRRRGLGVVPVFGLVLLSAVCFPRTDLRAALPPQTQAGTPPDGGVLTDSTDYRLPEILIQAARPVTTVGGSSAVELAVDSLALPAAPTLEQVLDEVPMLHVRKNSRGETELSARGSESRQVALLVDGVPLTLAWDARADVSVIPATAAREVVYIRGLSSMLYGPNVLGGIVEMSVGRSFRQPESASVQITMGADDVGSFGSTVAGSLPVDRENAHWLLRGGVGYRTTPGQPLAKGITEPVPTGNDLRLNTESNSLDGFFALRYRNEKQTWLSLSGFSTSGEREIPAELGVEDARFWRYPRVSRTVAVLSAGSGERTSPVGGRAGLEASIGLDLGRTEIDSYASREYEEKESFEDGEDRTLTLRVLGDQTLGARGLLRGALTMAAIRHEEILPDGRFEYRQRLFSVGGENIWRLLEGGGRVRSLNLSLGGAYDVGETPEAGGREPLDRISEWGGRAGLSLGLSGGAVVHAGLSRRGRFPALRELYSGALNRFAPNPDLKPETLVAMETGIMAPLGRGQVQLVGFHHRLNDAVVRITLSDRRFMRVNRNELRSTGLEWLGSQVLGPVALSADVTWQDVKLTDTEAEETHEPENLPEVYGSLDAGFPLVLGLRGHADVQYTGSQFCIDPGTGDDDELESGAIFGGYVSRTWRAPQSMGGAFSHFEARVSLDNAGDEALYDACGLPQPGRRVRFEVRAF